jgi:hypothetical protein
VAEWVFEGDSLADEQGFAGRADPIRLDDEPFSPHAERLVAPPRVVEAERHTVCLFEDGVDVASAVGVVFVVHVESEHARYVFDRFDS